MFVFGGNAQQKQISKVYKCQLSRVASIPFALNGGGCATFNGQVLLAFDYNDPNTSYRSVTLS